MASTREGYLAVKKETTVSTAVKPAHFLRYKDGDVAYNQEIIANNPIQNNRFNALNPVKGKVTTDGSYNVDLDVNECVYFLYMVLGAIASNDISSGTDGSVYKHDLTLANALPALTIEQGKGNLSDTSNNRQNYQVDRAFGVLVDSINLAGSDGLINMAVNLKAHGVFQKANMIADATAGASVDIELDTVEGLTTDDTVNIYDNTPQNEDDPIAAISGSPTNTIQIATLGNSYTVAKEGKVELTPQTPSYSDSAKVLSFIHASFQFGSDLTDAASNAEENVENWEFSYENNLEERYGSLRASPSVIAPKGASAKLKFTKYFENVQDRDRYLNQTKQACILTITNNEIVSATDTNNAKYTVQIKMSDVRFTKHEMPTGTDELYAVTAEAECYYDSSDGQAIKIEVTNGKVGTTYTA